MKKRPSTQVQSYKPVQYRSSRFPDDDMVGKNGVVKESLLETDGSIKRKYNHNGVREPPEADWGDE